VVGSEQPIHQLANEPNEDEPTASTDKAINVDNDSATLRGHVNPNGSDPTGGTALIFHDQYGGQNSSMWVFVENGKWVAEALLRYSNSRYVIWLGDAKVENGYEPVARKIFMRLRGSTNWVELTSVKKNVFADSGEQAEFIANASGIHSPSTN